MLQLHLQRVLALPDWRDGSLVHAWLRWVDLGSHGGGGGGGGGDDGGKFNQSVTLILLSCLARLSLGLIPLFVTGVLTIECLDVCM